MNIRFINSIYLLAFILSSFPIFYSFDYFYNCSYFFLVNPNCLIIDDFHSSKPNHPDQLVLNFWVFHLMDDLS